MKTSIRVTVHSPTKGTHEEEFNIIQFPSGEIGGHFSPEFVDFTAYAASSINNVIMIVKGYDKDTLFAVALAKEAIDDLIPHDYALKELIAFLLCIRLNESMDSPTQSLILVVLYPPLSTL